MARQATGDLDAAEPAISIAVKKQAGSGIVQIVLLPPARGACCSGPASGAAVPGHCANGTPWAAAKHAAPALLPLTRPRPRFPTLQVPVAAAYASGSGVGMAWEEPKKQAPPAAAFASGRGVGMAWH